MFINMGIDYLFYPEKARRRRSSTCWGHTSTTEYVDFSGGKLSLVVFKIDAASPLIDKSLIEITGDRDSLPYRRSPFRATAKRSSRAATTGSRRATTSM